MFSTKFNDKDKNGNDINAYVKVMSSIYSYINKNKICSYAYLDLFDSFLFYSGYSFIMNTNINNIAMFKLEKYLLSTRVMLAPYGLEYSLVNHFCCG
ncbi:hypothetical protein [Rickettsia canadensis]|uniref:hypothetical protein n=1 Tax=Rickettsia canadensis TaxID=788 RepID=UPI0002E8F12C|nr:hypothetical protein [Rickettsia canadensis]